MPRKVSNIAVDRASATLFAPVRTVTDADVSLTGLGTFSGVAVAENDRILVDDQILQKDNGVFVVKAGEWERAADASANTDFAPGRIVYVREGDKAGHIYSYSGVAFPVIDTTALTFSAPQAGGAIASLADVDLITYPVDDFNTLVYAAGTWYSSPLSFEMIKDAGGYEIDTNLSLTDGDVLIWDSTLGDNGRFRASIGGLPIFSPCVAVATTNIDLGTPPSPAIIDDVTASAGGTTNNPVVLLAGQTDPAENGLYDSTTWERHDSAAAGTQFRAGKLVSVVEGTANAETLWMLTSYVSDLGTDDITFVKLI